MLFLIFTFFRFITIIIEEKIKIDENKILKVFLGKLKLIFEKKFVIFSNLKNFEKSKTGKNFFEFCCGIFIKGKIAKTVKNEEKSPVDKKTLICFKSGNGAKKSEIKQISVEINPKKTLLKIFF